MGRAVPVFVFEESRSDFWCEAHIPPTLTSLAQPARRVGMRIPKECIPLLLNDDHPMRMQTTLDAADLRQLSVLIADRLKLCRVASPQQASRSYRYWLDGELFGAGSTTRADEGTARGRAETPGQFRLSLRKRGVGQIVFSRLVTFWVGTNERREVGKLDGGDPFNSGYGLQDGGNGDSMLSNQHVSQVQRVITMKEISHRGEGGEITGVSRDPTSTKRADMFALESELTKQLLEGRCIESATSGWEGCSPARYWRDALTWRLRLVRSETRSPEVGNEGLCQDGGLVLNKSGNVGVSSTHRDDGATCIAVDGRTPLLLLHGVSERREAPAPIPDTESGDDEPPVARSCTFDLIVLPGQGNAKPPKAEATFELVLTHQQTAASFSFHVPVTAVIEEFTGIVKACLSTPTSLLTELELSASDTLRAFAENWLVYSPEDGGNRPPVLTMTFPGMESMVTSPYVALRASRNPRSNASCLGRHTACVPYFPAKHGGETLRSQRPPLRAGLGPIQGSHDTEQPANASKVIAGALLAPCQPAREGVRGSILTTSMESRNERMVLRRKLLVPRLEDRRKRHKQQPPGQVHGHVASHRESTRLAPEELVISVYEVFAAGQHLRIERYIKFCARDETTRPAIEAAVAVPWVGTCEGVVGGALWRLATEGLSFCRTLDDRGRCIGMELEVTASEQVEERLEHQEKDLQQHEPTLVASGALEAMEELVEGNDWKGAGIDCHASDGLQHPTHHRETPMIEPSSLEHGPPATSAELGCEDVGSIRQPLSQHGETGPLVAALDSNETDASISCRTDTEGPATREELQIYDGWHSITGIRLHVQCFQEGGVTLAAGGMHGDVDEDIRRPAGRGGRISLPRASFLHFVVCDPATGRRNSARVSVDDARNNLSTDGGIVEAGLLDAGRRPALARAIAQRLRLRFNVEGSYRLVIPLPAEWMSGSHA